MELAGLEPLKRIKSELLSISEAMTVINLFPIGVPDKSPEPRPRKKIEELFSAEKYGQPLRL